MVCVLSELIKYSIFVNTDIKGVALYPPWLSKTSSTMTDRWSDPFDHGSALSHIVIWFGHKEAKIDLS